MSDKIDTRGLQATTKDAQRAAKETGSELSDLMADAAYLRQSSALINDALQKGFDVLQLADGDIVTTGTKTIVYQYSWDEKKSKLTKVKVKDSATKALRHPKVDVGDDEDEELQVGE